MTMQMCPYCGRWTNHSRNLSYKKKAIIGISTFGLGLLFTPLISPRCKICGAPARNEGPKAIWIVIALFILILWLINR